MIHTDPLSSKNVAFASSGGNLACHEHNSRPRSTFMLINPRAADPWTTRKMASRSRTLPEAFKNGPMRKGQAGKVISISIRQWIEQGGQTGSHTRSIYLERGKGGCSSYRLFEFRQQDTLHFQEAFQLKLSQLGNPAGNPAWDGGGEGEGRCGLGGVRGWGLLKELRGSLGEEGSVFFMKRGCFSISWNKQTKPKKHVWVRQAMDDEN